MMWQALVWSVAVVCMAMAIAGLGGLAGERDELRQLWPAFTTKAELQDAVNLWCGSSAGVTSTEATYGPISAWDVSQITDMSYLFQSKSTCNPDIGNWNTAALTNMEAMFSDAISFDQDIGNWNTATVTNMYSMFGGARAFNQDIGKWNTAAVTNMEWMFYNAKAFNQDIGKWNTAAVTWMSYMFMEASAFNQRLCWNAETAYKTSMFLASSGSLLSYPGCKSTASPSAQPTAQPTPQPTSLGRIGATGCADVTSAFDGSASQSVLYKEVASAAETCAICSGRYDLVATDSSSQAGLSKAVVDASAEVACSGSRAFATIGAKVYSTPLKNQGAMSCVADWNGVFADQAEYSQGLFSVTFRVR